MIIDIINKKRMGEELSYYELSTMFNGYLKKEVKDYQMSSLLMAICIRGMSYREVIDLTRIFIESGEVLDFTGIVDVTSDKHSTGGVGDKVTLLMLPILGACGVKIAKMSGRGLGFTGGTIDKVLSIPGFRVSLSDEEIIKQIKDIGIVLSSQNNNLVPMDKEIYALRDVSGTTNSIHLIAVSIMSKKIATGAKKILIDIKCGNGALVNNIVEAKKLSKLMIDIGREFDREVRCVISDMDVPLGTSVGNGLEVLEVIDILKRVETNNNLVNLTISLSSELISMVKGISKSDAKKLVINSINSGDALAKFLEFVKYQGGDISKLKLSKKIDIRASKSGIITDISAIEVAKVSYMLGAGRNSLDDDVDYGAGVKFYKLIGDSVNKGDIVCSLFTNKKIDKVSNLFEIS